MNVKGVDKQSVEEATREAQAKPLEFDPKERAAHIRQMLAEIPPLVDRGVPVEDIKKTYEDLSRQYKELFKKITEKQDLTPIRAMLAALDKMGEGRLTQHEASIKVGQRLVDTFVKPQLKGNAGDKHGR